MRLTTNLAEFGYKELQIAATLLQALAERNTTNSHIEFNQIMLCMDSGSVFLANNGADVARLTSKNELKIFYGAEEDEEEGVNEEDKEWFANLDKNQKNGE